MWFTVFTRKRRSFEAGAYSGVALIDFLLLSAALIRTRRLFEGKGHSSKYSMCFLKIPR